MTGAGTRSELFVKTGWDGETEGFHELDFQLDTLASQRDTLGAVP